MAPFRPAAKWLTRLALSGVAGAVPCFFGFADIVLSPPFHPPLLHGVFYKNLSWLLSLTVLSRYRQAGRKDDPRVANPAYFYATFTLSAGIG